MISIHAPRAGSDEQVFGGRKMTEHISIHAPRAGSDYRGLVNASDFKTFQSTLPVRGATCRRVIDSRWAT